MPVPFPDGFTRGVFRNVFPGRLDIFSAGHTHTASVDIEVWEAQPHVREPGAWDEQAEADFESTSGEVALWSMSLGRTEAAALSEDEGTGQGVERYLMQFWPAKS
ncbi:hypothetical protein [Streptomyces sp. NPDC001388]|uniref:hypothetical protein n=1 Tax=Streptomyces sp. NPDC001388 TaxID=3364568 RepID=UPI0036A2D6AC